MTLATLNSAPPAAAAEALLRCCGARAWAAAMVAARPFASREALHAAAATAWAALDAADWREAFAQHPRIGDTASLRERFGSTAEWAGREQSAAAQANETTLEALADGNREYEERFGHLFIVRASGRSAAEMLALLRGRLANDPAAELRVAAAQQLEITHLRLDQLLEEAP